MKESKSACQPDIIENEESFGQYLQEYLHAERCREDRQDRSDVTERWLALGAPSINRYSEQDRNDQNRTKYNCQWMAFSNVARNRQS